MSMEPQFLTVYFVCLLSHIIAEPARWVIYTGKHPTESFRKFFCIFTFSAFLGYVLPLKMGLPARIALLRWKTRLDLYQITSITAFDIAVTYGSWSLLALLVAPILSNLLGTEWFYAAIPLAVLTAGILLGVLMLRYGYPAVGKGKLSKTILLTKTKLHQAFSELSTGVMLQSLSVVVIDVFVIILLHWSLVRFAGYELSMSTIAMITVISSFVGLVSFTPMGLGTYDAAITFMLVQYGIPIEAAIAVPLAHRIGALIVSVPLGLISGIRLGIDPRRRDWVNRDMQASKSSAPVDSSD